MVLEHRPSEDLLLTPHVLHRRGVDLGGDARYMTDDQRGELIWHFLPYDAQAASEGLTAANAPSCT